MMHRSRSNTGEGQVASSPYRSSQAKNRAKVTRENACSVSPDPFQHAKALVESFGARTALQIAQFNAQLPGPNGRYWADVLDHVVDAWGRGLGDFAIQVGQMPHTGATHSEPH